MNWAEWLRQVHHFIFTEIHEYFFPNLNVTLEKIRLEEIESLNQGYRS